MEDTNIDSVDVTQSIEREWIRFSSQLREMLANGVITPGELERHRVTYYAGAYTITRVIAQLGGQLLALDNGPSLLKDRILNMQAEVNAQLHLAQVSKRSKPAATPRKGFRAVWRKR